MGKSLLTSSLPPMAHSSDGVSWSHFKVGLSFCHPFSAVLVRDPGCPVLGTFLRQMTNEGRQVPLESYSEHLNSAVIKLSVTML